MSKNGSGKIFLPSTLSDSDANTSLNTNANESENENENEKKATNVLPECDSLRSNSSKRVLAELDRFQSYVDTALSRDLDDNKVETIESRYEREEKIGSRDCLIGRNDV